MSESWLISGAVRDRQGITKDWDFVGKTRIDGVLVREMKSVLAGYGYLTEMFRGEWFPEAPKIDQVFQSVLEPGKVTAWHAHEHTIDRLFVSSGRLLIALYDSRESSPTFGMVNEFRVGIVRPAVLVIPPKIWHGVRNIGNDQAVLVNMVDKAYDYENPDHWRVPADTPSIPYTIT